MDRVRYRRRADHGKSEVPGVVKGEGNQGDGSGNSRSAFLAGLAAEPLDLHTAAFPLDQTMMARFDSMMRWSEVRSGRRKTRAVATIIQSAGSVFRLGRIATHS